MILRDVEESSITDQLYFYIMLKISLKAVSRTPHASGQPQADTAEIEIAGLMSDENRLSGSLDSASEE